MFLERVEKEAPELCLIPLAEVDGNKGAKWKMEGNDEWLEAVSRIINGRKIDFHLLVSKVRHADEAKNFPRAYSWRRGGKCGVVLRRFQDANFQWVTPWDSGENWGMIVFELMNLEGFPKAGETYESHAEMIENVARSEFRAMKRANEVFYQSWAPYCRKIGAKQDMYRVPWKKATVAMGEDEWAKVAASSAHYRGYREWITSGTGDRVEKPFPDFEFTDIK